MRCEEEQCHRASCGCREKTGGKGATGDVTVAVDVFPKVALWMRDGWLCLHLSLHLAGGACGAEGISQISGNWHELQMGNHNWRIVAYTDIHPAGRHVSDITLTFAYCMFSDSHRERHKKMITTISFARASASTPHSISLNIPCTSVSMQPAILAKANTHATWLNLFTYPPFPPRTPHHDAHSPHHRLSLRASLPLSNGSTVASPIRLRRRVHTCFNSKKKRRRHEK